MLKWKKPCNTLVLKRFSFLVVRNFNEPKMKANHNGSCAVVTAVQKWKQLKYGGPSLAVSYRKPVPTTLLRLPDYFSKHCSNHLNISSAKST